MTRQEFINAWAEVQYLLDQVAPGTNIVDTAIARGINMNALIAADKQYRLTEDEKQEVERLKAEYAKQ